MTTRLTFLADSSVDPLFYPGKRNQLRPHWEPESFQLSQLERRYYTMRAYNTNLTQYVTWESINEPDLTGASSPYLPIDLEDIGVIKVDIRAVI